MEKESEFVDIHLNKMPRPVPDHELNVRSINRFDRQLRMVVFWIVPFAAIELWFESGPDLFVTRLVSLATFVATCMFFYGAIWAWEIHMAHAGSAMRMRRSLRGWVFLGLAWLTIVVAFHGPGSVDITYAGWRQINFMFIVLGLISSFGGLRLSQLRMFFVFNTKYNTE
jgi:hypothetical protein